ncbi:DNA-3-methyladenine glycosylase I [Reinekea sp.]|uniref:DNA-3-methyladenine glycosylase I n=1 Tax=Reinekea sp. TaxID=1970455 RepID=UPI002A80E07E|nr:DNA-3-methyladenine glycosylase I [Reinekea sp.]
MTFDDYWHQALNHYQDAALLRARFPQLRTAQQLRELGDDRYLSTISQRVFRAGMRHSVVDSRWPAFEEQFWGFDPRACQLIDDGRFEQLMLNKALIRHWRKMKTVPINAQMVSDLSQEFGSFGEFIAQWPGDEIVGLWQLLKKRGAFLGGDGGARVLRMLGKDTFVLSNDVVRVLVNHAVVSAKPTGLRDLNRVQAFFNTLHDQSGLPLSAISTVLAMSIGP